MIFCDFFANSTTTTVWETAERAKAEVLLQQCQEYAEKNMAYILKVESLNLS